MTFELIAEDQVTATKAKEKEPPRSSPCKVLVTGESMTSAGVCPETRGAEAEQTVVERGA